MKMAEVQIELTTSDLVEALEEHIDVVDDEVLKRFVNYLTRDIGTWLGENARSFSKTFDEELETNV